MGEKFIWMFLVKRFGMRILAKEMTLTQTRTSKRKRVGFRPPWINGEEIRGTAAGGRHRGLPCWVLHSVRLLPLPDSHMLRVCVDFREVHRPWARVPADSHKIIYKQDRTTSGSDGKPQETEQQTVTPMPLVWTKVERKKRFSQDCKCFYRFLNRTLELSARLRGVGFAPFIHEFVFYFSYL